jgi:hypothetical protein
VLLTRYKGALPPLPHRPKATGFHLYLDYHQYDTVNGGLSYLFVWATYSLARATLPRRGRAKDDIIEQEQIPHDRQRYRLVLFLLHCIVQLIHKFGLSDHGIPKTGPPSGVINSLFKA